MDISPNKYEGPKKCSLKFGAFLGSGKTPTWDPEWLEYKQVSHTVLCRV